MKFTWLHISDFHFRENGPYDQSVILRALVESVKRFCDEGRKPDLIFATGDIAYSGKPSEYDLATQFLDDLLNAAGLEPRHLFVIPGNHDNDRKVGRSLKRTLEDQEESDEFFDPAGTLPQISLKQAAFVQWFNSYFAGIRTFPINSSCGPVESIPVGGGSFGILPINSALFAQDDNDHGKLWVGRRSLDAAIQELSALKAELSLALIHHPLEWLHEVERSNIKAKLQGNVHFLLQGHLHDPEFKDILTEDGEALHFVAGATYQTRKYPNTAFYCSIDGTCCTVFPIRYEDRPKEIWTVDPSLFPKEKDYQKAFPIPTGDEDSGPHPARSAAFPSEATTTPRFRSNVPSRQNRPFVGRDTELAAIKGLLPDLSCERVVALHGQPGCGKSELAREFARLNGDRYPGGTFFIDAAQGDIPIDLARVGKYILALVFPPDLPLEDQCFQALFALGSTPTLVIYDNVISVEAIGKWLPPARMPCHVIVTTVLNKWDPGWLDVPVEPLQDQVALELVEKLAGTEVVQKFGARLVELAGGLPMQLYPQAVSLAYEQRRGRLDLAELTIAEEANQSFRGVYMRLEQAQQILLHAAAHLNPQRIVYRELWKHFSKALKWNESDFQRNLDVCIDLHLLDGQQDLRMHQLFASFLAGAEAVQEVAEQLAIVRQAQFERFVEIAAQLIEKPADAELATMLMGYRFNPGIWSDLDDGALGAYQYTIGNALIEIGKFDEAFPWLEVAVRVAKPADVYGHVDRGRALHAVGDCLSSMGKFEEALPWYEQAIQAKEKRDARDRVDYQSLGSSLHQVGYCLSSMGKFEEALPRYKRAVQAAEKGDVLGRVDPSRLGGSMHQMGLCLSDMGRFEEALPWAERAVAAMEKGDLQGQVDYQRLGSGLHQVGYCLSSIGKFEEALPFYERAVQATEKGDLYGRVDYHSLGRSLHGAGYCWSSLAKYPSALPWFQRAVGASSKGDIHGRVSFASLGNSLHEAAICLSRMGKFEEALPGYKRAVQAKEKGDFYGRVDHQSLASSLHQVGFCWGSLRDHARALPWYERAVESSEKGDQYGRVDHHSLAGHLHQVGCTLVSMGKFDEALRWFQRAVQAAEKGDVHACVDHQSLGKYLHQGGYCLWRIGRHLEALVWFERAVETKDKGDVRGRVDHEDLAVSLRGGAQCLRSLGREEEAQEWEDRAAMVDKLESSRSL